MISEKNTPISRIAYWCILTLSLISVPLVATGDPLPADTFYVAPGGDDNNPGTLELPLRSLEAARQKVRDHKATVGLGTEGIAVILREGTWTRTQSLVLSSQDSGEPGRPVVWRAFPGETVRVLGAATVQANWFEPVTSAHPEWTRLPAEARGNVLRARLSDHGLTDYGQLSVRGGGYPQRTGALELFVDQEPMPLARWPDPDQHDGLPSHQDLQLTLYKNTQPDVSGGWTQSGTRDGVNAYTRDDLVNGIPYYLYRRTWQYDGTWHTAWFIAAQDSGYPGSQHPWWVFYNQDLGIFNPKNGAIGTPTVENPAAIKWGFAAIENRLSDSRFTVATDRMSRWTSAADPWFHGYWNKYFAEKHVNASSIDPATRTVTLAASPPGGLVAGMPFYALNLLEEITRPGEWYLERSTGFLYWWPKGAIGSQEIMVSMLEEPLLEVYDAEHLQFVDLSFGMGRQDLVTVVGTDVAFERCRFFGAGNDGIHLTGQNHRLEHSEVVDTGDQGVVLDGGDRESLSPGNHLVENSEIHRFGRWSWTYMPGIQIRGVGHRVAHNHVHDGPHSAILFRGNQHLIEYNEINNVVRFASDAGAIYASRHWDWRGNRIEYNYIHHIDSFFPGPGEHGVYLDDVMSGVGVFGNLFVEVSGFAMFHGGGRDNLFENNVVVRSGTAFNSDSRGVERITDIPGDSWNLLERLHDEGVEYQGAVWCSTWPELCAIPDSSAAIFDPNALWLYPEGSVFSRNIGWQNGLFMREHNWAGSTFDKFAEIEDNLENTDPRFVNEAAGDYRLAANSPALSIPGFVDIPFQQMGIVGQPPDDDVTSLILVNQVTNNNGGSAVPADWTLSASGGPTPFSGPGPSVSSDANFQAGSYLLSEISGWSGYTASAWACNGGSLTGATLTLAQGESATCTITNDDDVPSLSLDNIVVNNNGGTALESDWTLFASNGPTPISGPGAAGSTDVQSGASFHAGTYNLSESTGPAGYTASSWSCAGGSLNGSALTIALGESATCTITNDDDGNGDSASLTLINQVTNNNGGNAVPADWTLSASGGPALHLDSYGSTQPNVSGGWTRSGTRDGVSAYTRDELVNGIPYYLYRYSWQSSGGTWVTAWFIAAQDDGWPGNQHPFWVLFSEDLGTFNTRNGATGNPTIETPTPVAFSGPGPSVSSNAIQAGSYVLTESGGPAGYTASTWNCDGGSLTGATLTLAQGESATCTITYDDDDNGDSASLTLINQVTNNNGGNAVPADWTLSASGGPALHLDSYGSTQPNVSGGWTRSGTRDGVSAYTRDELVNGIPYYLYRYSWQSSGGTWVTAWFIAAQDDGWPGNQHPFWVLFSEDLGTFNTRNGATGNPTIETPTPVAFSGPGPSVSSNAIQAGSYVLTESGGPDGYTASAWACNGGSLQGATLTLAQGESATCTITNDDDDASPPPSSEPIELFYDSFENGAWDGLWNEDSQNDWFVNSQRDTSGSRSAEVDGPASGAQLVSIPIDLQGRSNAEITFNWYIERSLDSGEYLVFDVSTNGGSNWTEYARLRGNVDSEDTWHQVQLELNDISSLQLRFRANMSSAREDANVDDVVVTAN